MDVSQLRQISGLRHDIAVLAPHEDIAGVLGVQFLQTFNGAHVGTLVK
jgi:hypothetical protein